MCHAYPGRRCANHAYDRWQKAKAAYEAAPQGTLARGVALNDLKLAAADYAATCKATNPDLHAAAQMIRDEQVALMPPKPAINEPGVKEWETLAGARHRLASTLTAMYQDERAGTVTYESGQGMYEEAVMGVVRAEDAYKQVAWQRYDVEPLAKDVLLDAQASGDKRRIERAQAVYYLSVHHDWPEQAEARNAAAHAKNDERLLDATWEERQLVRYAQSELPKLARAASPHTGLVREHPGETMPPAPWVKGPTRDVDPSDTPQVRWLCEGVSAGTRFDRDSGHLLVRNPSQVAVRRLWAYGFHTEDQGGGITRVTLAPDLRHYAARQSKRATAVA